MKHNLMLSDSNIVYNRFLASSIIAGLSPKTMRNIAFASNITIFFHDIIFPSMLFLFPQSGIGILFQATYHTFYRYFPFLSRFSYPWHHYYFYLQVILSPRQINDWRKDSGA